MRPDRDRGGMRAPVEARWLLIGCLAFIVAVIATPLAAWSWLAAEGLLLAFAIGFLGVPFGRLARRWLALAPVLIGLGLMLGLNRAEGFPGGPPGRFLAITGRNGLALAAALALGLACSTTALIAALQRLGCPRIVVATLHFMERYGQILGDERDRMLIARRARTFQATSPLAGWRSLGNLLGALFVRAMERGDRVHRAMLARGWDGTIRSLDEPREAS